MWFDCAPELDMMVVSEIGEIWSPQTAPASTADTATIIMVGSVSENILTTMGTRIANVPQLVPEENAIKIAMQKISSGTKRMRPSFRLTAWRTKSPMPSASVMPFSVQASTRIRMGGIISLPPSGTEFMKSLKPITRRGR